MFLTCLLIGWALVLFQIFFAFLDGWLTRTQLVEQELRGEALLEILAVWADAIIIIPIVAYLMSEYRFVLLSKLGIGLFIAIIATCIIFGKMFAAKAKAGTPDAWNHDSELTPAGYCHGIFAVLCAWALFMFYLTTPSATPTLHRDLIWISLLLTPFFWLGVARTAPGWKMDRLAWGSTIVSPLIVWTVTLFRIYIFDPSRQ